MLIEQLQKINDLCKEFTMSRKKNPQSIKSIIFFNNFILLIIKQLLDSMYHLNIVNQFYNQSIFNRYQFKLTMFERDLNDQLMENAHEKKLQHQLQNFKQYEKLKKQLILQGKAKIQSQFAQLQKEQLAKHKIQRSASINHSRMSKARKKFQLCDQIFREVQIKIKQLIKQDSNQYQLILITLIVEGVIRLFQEECEIKCLPKDLHLVKQILGDCKTTYDFVMQEQIGRTYDLNLRIIQNDPMKQRQLDRNKETFLQKKDQDSECIGGIVLRDKTGNIVYKNTFDTRLNILKQICLPDIRQQIWGQNNNDIYKN